MKLISIVVPMLNEEEIAPIFVKAIEDVFASITNYDYEIVAINDGSSDNTLAVLKELQEHNNKIVIVNLSRNFGHEPALYAGLQNAKGDAVIPMDADLQDPPEVIPELIAKWEEGYQVVNARRASRKEDSFLKRTTASMFYNWSNKISKKVKMPRNVANFRLIDRRVLNEVLAFGEKNRVFRVQVPYVGFKVCEVLFSRPKRRKGVSKYNPKAMFSLAISSTISLTVRPLEWSIGITILLGVLSLLSCCGELTLFILHLCKIVNMSEVGLWSWLIINILMILSTLIVFVVAILSQYIAKNTIETLARPSVIVDEVIRK